MADDKNLDLLDLEDDDIVLSELNNGDPFCKPRPKRPWLLFGLGLMIIVMATYIIISVIRKGEEDSIDIDLGDANVPITGEIAGQDGAQQPKPFVEGADKLILGHGEEVKITGTTTRVVETRKPVKFDPSATPNVEAPKPRPIVKPEPVKAKPVTITKKPEPKPQPAKVIAGGWSVQFASISTRSGAEAAAAKMKREHASLLSGKSFVILAAELPNGTMTYRVRVSGFRNAADADGFCRNAKSDGLECYAVK